MTAHTYAEIAASFDLWQEYVDTAGTTSREEFDAMSTADRIAAQIEAFGPEPEPVPTVQDVINSLPIRGIDCGSLGMILGWRTEGGEVEIAEMHLRPILESAYDPTMPNWPAMVEIDDA